MTDELSPKVTELQGQLPAARKDLRERQAYWANALGVAVDPAHDMLAAALQLAAYRESQGHREGDYIQYGHFRYKADLEEKRWALVRGIIDRVIPGPYEDPNYLVIVARHAASVEFLIERARDSSATEALREALSRILIGTTGEPMGDAYSTLVDGVALILISAGMIEFLYQTAKAVALSQKPQEPANGSEYAFSGRAEDTEEVLSKDPYPADLFYDTLSTWLYEGRPRAPYSKSPPPSYDGPLTVLINGAERFLVAHEYGHAFMHQLRIMPPSNPQPGTPEDSWLRELQADNFATYAVIQSSALLDLVTANVSLQGAVMAMRVLQVFESSQQIATTGKQSPEVGTKSHPPFTERLKFLEEEYVREHPDPSVARQDLLGMTFPADIVDQLWNLAAPRLVAQFQAGRPLHPIWSMAGI